MPAIRNCSVCGDPLTAERCLRCESQSKYHFIHREIMMLAVLVGVAVAAFFVTRRFAAANQHMRLQDAHAWYTIGERALNNDSRQSALDAFRRAAAKAPDQALYRLALASALVATHQDEAARQVLLDLREQQVEDPQTNLELARLEAQRQDVTAASRYYTNALAALWKPDQTTEQRQVRTEFVGFLLDHGQRDRALSELLVLEATLPDDLPAQLAAGNMLLAARDAARAFRHFMQALRADPKNRLALAGAGECAFLLGDYDRARRYFNMLTADTDRTRDLRVLTELILSSDPLGPRLQMAERRRRLAVAVSAVIHRLERCWSRPGTDQPAATTSLTTALADARGIDVQLRSPHPPDSSDAIETAFDQIYRGEHAAEGACAAPEPFDRALLLIGQRHGLEDQ